MEKKYVQLSLFDEHSLPEIKTTVRALNHCIDAMHDVKSAHIIGLAAIDYLLCESGRVMSKEESFDWGIELLAVFEDKVISLQSSLKQIEEELTCLRSIISSEYNDC